MPRVGEAHKAARRDQIVAAAPRCFHRNGFHPTTMDDIVRESGLSAGAVYTYFRSNDELNLAAGSHKFDELRETFDSLVRTDPTPTPAQMMHTLLDRIVEITITPGMDLTRIIVSGWGEAQRNPTLLEVVREDYAHFATQITGRTERWRESGDVAPDVDPAEAAPVLLSFVLGFIVQRAVVGPIDPDAYARGAAALIQSPPRQSPPRQ